MPTVSAAGGAPTAEALRAAFAEPSAPTVGLEEELMLLDADGLDLLPRVPELLARTAGDLRFKAEMPAAQVEIVAPPAHTVAAGARSLAAARVLLAGHAEALGARLAGAGTHPFTSPFGVLTDDARYAAMLDEFGDVARVQLVFGLHVHVAVRPVERAVRVHDALRSYLPELAALGACAPFLAGRDTGLASVRPKISEALPRQGVPPALGSVEGWARALAWGERAGALPAGTRWWWEQRLHPLHGTLEVRVCDAQPTVADTAALAAVVHCLVTWLAERDAAGEALPVHELWRIQANRWSACRHGTDAVFADLDTGVPQPGRERLHGLLDELEPLARRLGCTAELAGARALVDDPPARRLRARAAEGGSRGATRWLADRFLDGCNG